jgi:hypothetical protein
MKKTALYVQAEASKKYSPYTLKEFLIRLSNEEVVVDRESLLKTQDDARLFYVVLSKDYGWDYRYPETSTIYFEVIDGKVFGGVYESNAGRRSRRLVAVENSIAKEYDYNLYSYDSDTLSEIIGRICR